eukprot:SM000153S01609  [mRNA]  locus=s153:192329:197990:+ [translate_table: standard]
MLAAIAIDSVGAAAAPRPVDTLRLPINLQLPGQQLTGTMPSSLGNLTSLTTLHLYNNNLSGSIPPTLGNLAQLSLLNLDNNTLTGSIPTTLCQLSQLTLLHLAINKLTGTIPKNITQLPKLVILIVNINNISGAIPTGLENLTQLTKFVFGSNLLTGSIPSGISKIQNLTVLDLGNNKLTGAFPTWINSLKQLQQLILSGNNLTGSVPSSLGTVTTLTRLDVSRNTLSGPFPASVVALVNVTKLKTLDCSSNYFNGSLPKPPATGGGIVTNFNTNCFGVNVTSFPAGQRSFAQCATFYHIPIPPPPPRSCMINADCPLPAGYTSSCASTSCSGGRCTLVTSASGSSCYNNRTGVDPVCSRDTCDGHGRCVTQAPRNDPPGGDYSCASPYAEYNYGFYYAYECVQFVCRNGACTLVLLANTTTCQVSDTPDCSPLCDGHGFCNKNARVGLPCSDCSAPYCYPGICNEQDCICGRDECDLRCAPGATDPSCPQPPTPPPTPSP